MDELESAAAPERSQSMDESESAGNLIDSLNPCSQQNRLQHSRMQACIIHKCSLLALVQAGTNPPFTQ